LDKPVLTLLHNQGTMVLWIFSLPFGFARGNVYRRARMRHIHWKNVHPHL